MTRRALVPRIQIKLTLNQRRYLKRRARRQDRQRGKKECT